MINIEICEKFGRYAVQAMLYEVTATPKPGLVDRSNSGAHKDMDFFTFMSSSASLSKYFYQCSFVTITYLDCLDDHNPNYQDIFCRLRELGIEAEKNMYEATKGINTHKGLIFSLGLIVSAATIVYYKTKDANIELNELCEEIKNLSDGLCEKDFKATADKEILSAGEKLYLKSGIKGIRGEAEKGFPTVKNVSYPILNHLMKQSKYPLNDVLVQVLLHLMKVTEDTNIISRHDTLTLSEVKRLTDQALDMGGMFTDAGKYYIQNLDKSFIKKNISPGGSADLLAVTIMFYLLRYNHL